MRQPGAWRLSRLHTWLKQAALFNLLISALGTPPAIATGLLSWYYNYSSVWTPIYRAKTYLSIALCLLTAGALVLRFALLDGTETGGVWYWVYCLLVMAHAPDSDGAGVLWRQDHLPGLELELT